MDKILIISALLVFAGIFKAIMDIISEGRWSGWWNKIDSWTLKWKGGKMNKSMMKIKNTRHWWYLGLYRTTFPERFPYSSTILVWLTDGWHFFQFMFNRCWQGVILVAVWEIPNALFIYIGLSCLFSIVFEIMYKNIKTWQ